MSEPKMKFFIKLGVILILVILEISLGILGEILPDDFKTTLVDLVGKENYKSIYIIVFAFVASLYFFLKYYTEEINKEDKIEYTYKLRTKVISTLAESYKERLKQKLDERIKLNLELKFTTEGTDKEYVKRYFFEDAKSEKDLNVNLLDCLKKYHFILLTGEPGTGKTTLLLELATELLQITLNDKNLPIPIIFNLQSWNKTYPTFEKWMIEVLVQGNNFSKAFATKLVNENLILPLIDGLDELGDKFEKIEYKSDLRIACIQAIEQYLSRSNIKNLIISSRLNEYSELKVNAPVNAEILIKPLELEQVLQILHESINTENPNIDYLNPNSATNLLNLIKENSALKTLICIPFYFNTLVQIFSKRKSYNVPNEIFELKEYIIVEFLNFKLIESELYANKFNSLKWIINIAQQAHFNNITFFRLDSFWIYNNRFRKFLKEDMDELFDITIVVVFFFADKMTPFVSLFLLCYFPPFDIYSVGIEKMKVDFKLNFNRLFDLTIYGMVIMITIPLLQQFDTNHPVSLYSFIIVPIYFLCYLFVNNKPLIVLSNSTDGYLYDFICKLFYIIFLIYYFFYFDLFNSHQLNRMITFNISPIKNLDLIVIILVSLTRTLLFKYFLNCIVNRCINYAPFNLLKFYKFLTEQRILEYEHGYWRFRHKIIQDYFVIMDVKQFFIKIKKNE